MLEPEARAAAARGRGVVALVPGRRERRDARLEWVGHAVTHRSEWSDHIRSTVELPPAMSVDERCCHAVTRPEPRWPATRSGAAKKDVTRRGAFSGADAPPPRASSPNRAGSTSPAM